MTNDLDATADGVAADNNNSVNVGVQAGTIVIAKSTTPSGGTGFKFTDDIATVVDALISPASSGLDASLTLDDAGTKTFAHLPVPVTYTVDETDPLTDPGSWKLSAINCVGGASASGSVNAGGAGGKATIDLIDNETVTCTFENFQDADLADLLCGVLACRPVGDVCRGRPGRRRQRLVDDPRAGATECQHGSDE